MLTKDRSVQHCGLRFAGFHILGCGSLVFTLWVAIVELNGAMMQLENIRLV